VSLKRSAALKLLPNDAPSGDLHELARSRPDMEQGRADEKQAGSLRGGEEISPLDWS